MSHLANRLVHSIANIIPTDGAILIGNGTTIVSESGATARTSLGLAIGTNVQAFGAVLDDLSTLGANAADGEFLVGSAAGTLVWESGATARASLSLVIGTDVQAFNAHLEDLASLPVASADGEMMVATGAGAWALESGATLRTSIGVGSNDTPSFATPTQTSHAATKGYVDSVAEGLSVKQAVVAATVAALPEVTYANGTGGVLAQLTATANGAISSQDGVTLSAFDRILVKNQASSLQNGVYILKQVGDGSNPFVLERASDFDDSTAVKAGSFFFVQQGTTQGDTGWVLTSDGVATVGATALDFTQFTGAAAIVVGTGATRTGNTINVIGGHGITANADDLAVASDSTTGGNVQGVHVSANGVGLDINAIAGTGIEADGAANLRLATQGNGIAGGGGTTLSVNLDGSTLSVSGSGLKVNQINSSQLDLTGNYLFSGAVQSGGRIKATSAKTGAYTLALTDHIILADPTSAAFTITLPAAAGKIGAEFVIKHNSSSDNDVTIDGYGAETIDGVTTLVLSARSSATLVGTGSGWAIL